MLLASLFKISALDMLDARSLPLLMRSFGYPCEDMKVAVLKAGLAKQDYRKKQEMWPIFKCGTMNARGLKAMLHEAFFLATCNATNVALQVASCIKIQV